MSERFEIMKELGRGSHGIVYLASDLQKGKNVALKIFSVTSPLKISVGSDEFQNEFSILSGLHNPSLAEIYAFGFDSEGKSYFLAEEYFEGVPLSRWSERLSFQKLSAITAQICHVLQFLHQQKIFHGDLKPNNILINEKEENHIKLVDFGLSARFDLTSHQETADMIDREVRGGTISGTLPYMAPELFMGAPIDGRSDLYSLGATLYELVSGHPPFEGPGIHDIIEQHLFEMPINPILEGSSLPREFGFFILRLLNKDPGDRFEEANDVIRALNLQFHFNFPLGPEKSVLTPAQAEEIQKKHVERLYEWAVRFYKDRDDPESRRLLAEIYFRQGNWDEAESLLADSTGVRVQLLLLQIGLKKGCFESVLEEGSQLSQGTLEETQRDLLFNILGEANYYLGQNVEAEEAFCQVKNSNASHLISLGNLKLREDQWEEAKELFERSIALSRERGDIQSEGLCLVSLGHACQLKRKNDEALELYTKGEAILETIGYRPGVAQVKSHLANLFTTIGSLEKGEEKLRQAEEIAIEKGDRFLIATCRLLAGDLFRKKVNLSEACAAYREGKRLFHELKCSSEEAIADRNLAEMEAALKAEEEAKVEVPVAAVPLTRDELTSSFLKRVLTINRQISLLQDVDPILEIIIDSMIELTGAERGYLILREEGKNVVKVMRNIERAEDNKEAAHFSNSLIDQVLKSGESIVTLDAMTDERFSLSLSIHQLKLRSIICIPFRVREATIGAIYLESRLQRGAFSESAAGLLQAFVDQAAIAISNAWAFEELKDSAAELKRSKDEIEDLNRQLKEALSEKEIELKQTKQTLASKQAALELKYRYDEIVGRSPPMAEVLKLLDRVIEGDSPVFLYGESGTGKELIARAIHFNGPRAKGPFVPVNCSAIPETLLEAELFGYVKGAFTGADRDREGLFASANKGTLFLDEIGDMPLAMQAKLLRVLEDREVRPVGSQSQVHVDVRIVTASNQDLKDLVQEKKFRDDLYFRIHGLRIFLPPLRERKEDLPILIDYFLEKFAKEKGVTKKGLSRAAFELLSLYSWPGNIRELEITIKNACLLSEGDMIGPEDLRQKEELFTKVTLQATIPSEKPNEALSLRDLREGFEKEKIQAVLKECGGNISEAARKLKVARPQLSRLVKRLGLKEK